MCNPDGHVKNRNGINGGFKLINVGVSPDYQPTPTGLNPNRPYRLDNGIIKRRVEQGKWLPFQANNPPGTVTPVDLHKGIIYPEWPHVAIYEQPGSTDGELINYPVFITIPYVSGYMRSDFQDIRFATLDGRKLDYCFVDCVDGDHADFYVKIPDLSASPAINNIKVYCGNLNATTTADPDNVPAFYNSMDNISDWTVVAGTWTNPGAYTQSGSGVKGGIKIHFLDDGSPKNYTFRIQRTSGSNWGGILLRGITADAGGNGYENGNLFLIYSDHIAAYLSTNGNSSSIASRNYTFSPGVWYNIQITTTTTGFIVNVNGNQVLNVTNSTYPTGTTIRFLSYDPDMFDELNVIPTATPPATGTLGAWSETRYVSATENIMVQGNVLGDSPMSAPKPDDDIVFEVDGVEYAGLENFNIEKRGNDAASTFDVSYLTAEDLILMTGQGITFKERYGDKDGFYSGAIQDVKDSNVDSERTWTITGRDTGSKLISQPFTLACVESNPTSYTSYQLLDMILDGMGVELGPCVDITVTGIVNQNNVFKGFGGNWDTRAAALNDLLALVSRVLGKNVNWFIDKKGLLRIFYTDVPDTSIGISILKDNPRMLSLEVEENSENLVNDLTGTAGENNNITTHLQDTASINGWTDPDTGLIWPGYGVQTGEPIQDSTITNQSDLNAKVQNELNLHSKPIFTATIVLSRFPDCEMGQPVYFPDHYKLRGMTFVITAITLNGDSADRTTTIVATTDRSIIGPLSDYEAVNSIAKYAVKEYAPFTAVVTDVGKNGVTVQPVNEPGTVNARNLGG